MLALFFWVKIGIFGDFLDFNNTPLSCFPPGTQPNSNQTPAMVWSVRALKSMLLAIFGVVLIQSVSCERWIATKPGWYCGKPVSETEGDRIEEGGEGQEKCQEHCSQQSSCAAIAYSRKFTANFGWYCYLCTFHDEHLLADYEADSGWSIFSKVSEGHESEQPRPKGVGSGPGDVNSSGFRAFIKKAGHSFQEIRRVNEFRYDTMFDKTGRTSGKGPVVITNAGQGIPALQKWAKPGYLHATMDGTRPLTRFTTSDEKFVWGSEVYLEQEDPKLRVFGERPASDKEVIYTGAADFFNFPDSVQADLLRDLAPLPPFMRAPLLPQDASCTADTCSDGKANSMVWASNGDVDSGLHFDRNGGGFLMVVTGRKDVVLFPPSDGPNLYTKPVEGGSHESSCFIGRDLKRENHDVFPDLWKTTPYVTTLLPGDVLYTPHEWWHEVSTIGKTVAYSVWVTHPGGPGSKKQGAYGGLESFGASDLFADPASGPIPGILPDAIDYKSDPRFTQGETNEEIQADKQRQLQQKVEEQQKKWASQKQLGDGPIEGVLEDDPEALAEIAAGAKVDAAKKPLVL